MALSKYIVLVIETLQMQEEYLKLQRKYGNIFVENFIRNQWCSDEILSRNYPNGSYLRCMKGVAIREDQQRLRFRFAHAIEIIPDK